ncbi:MAG TPA: acyl-CoA dehydrogenase family protein [bacterium]|nr:acyl-CoA dehydrogenase family protein [bacterium]
MDWQLSDDQRMVVDMVRDFAANEVRPLAAHLDEAGQFPLDNLRKMAGLGLMGMNVPAEYGGSPVGAVALSLAISEMARACASTAITMSVTNMVAEAINAFGTEEQKRAFIPKIVSGDYPMGSFCLTEPNAGSDAASLAVRAVRDGDHWVLNGTKAFVSHGAYSSVLIVWARTSDAPKAAGVSAFIVERETPGLSVGKSEDKMGLRGSNTVSLIFEDCRVPADQMLSEEGKGFRIAMMALDGGRIGVSSQAVGIGQAALDASVEYAKIREQFGKPIGRLEAIQWFIADMATELEAARNLTLRAAWLKENGKKFSREASTAKLFATERLNVWTKNAVQIHGGYGYTKEYVVERLIRDAKVLTIYEGTSEIQRLVVSRALLEE